MRPKLRFLRPRLLLDVREMASHARQLAYWQEMDDEEGFKERVTALETEIVRELEKLDRLLAYVHEEGLRVFRERAKKRRRKVRDGKT